MRRIVWHMAGLVVLGLALAGCGGGESSAALETPKCDRWDINGQFTVKDQLVASTVTLALTPPEEVIGTYEASNESRPGVITGTYQGDQLKLQFVAGKTSADLTIQSDGKTLKGTLNSGQPMEMWLVSRQPQCLY